MMKTHKQLIKEMLKDPAVRAEHKRIEREEMPMLDASLNGPTERRKTRDALAEQAKALDTGYE